MSLAKNRFTWVKPIGKWKFRQFVKPQITIGILPHCSSGFLTRRPSRLVTNPGDYARSFSGMSEETREELIQKVAHFTSTRVKYYKREG